MGNEAIYWDGLTTVNTTDIVITVLQKTIGYQIQCSVFGISLFPQSSTLCLNLVIPNITPGAYIWGGGRERGGLYMEGVFHSKRWFLSAPGLIHGGVYYWNFTVY